MTIEISLTKGKVAIIDDADWDLVSGHRWRAVKGGNCYYAYANVRRADGSRTTIKMHRLLLGLTDTTIKTDHRDRNGLNNTRANIRACSNAQNMRNTGAYANNKSGLKGVRLDNRIGKWRAEIRVDGKWKWLGHHDTKEAAHEAYCRAAAELHGEFANFGITGVNDRDCDSGRQANGRGK